MTKLWACCPAAKRRDSRAQGASPGSMSGMRPSPEGAAEHRYTALSVLTFGRTPKPGAYAPGYSLSPLRGLALAGLIITAVLLTAFAADSPVADAAMRGDREAVRTLLQKGADVDAARGDGMTALHWAAERGDAEMTEMLILAGANPRAVTRIGLYTPLHIASRGGHAAIAENLLKAGANVNAKTTNS